MNNQNQLSCGYVRQYFAEQEDEKQYTAKEIAEIIDRFCPLVPNQQPAEEWRVVWENEKVTVYQDSHKPIGQDQVAIPKTLFSSFRQQALIS